MAHRARRYGPLFIACLAAASGCGDQYSESKVSAGADAGRWRADGGVATVPYALEVRADSDGVVVSGTERGLEVTLRALATGEPVADESIRFTIESGASLGALSSAASTTGPEGRARVGVRALTGPGEVVVRASHDKARSSRVTLRLEPRAKGALGVVVTDATGRSPAPVDLRASIWRGSELSCREFVPGLAPSAEPLASLQAPEAGALGRVGGLDAERAYVVTVTGAGERGQIMAAGCVEGIELAPGREVIASVPLELIALDLSGRYRARATWDFSRALTDGGGLANDLGRVIGFFEDPGRSLYDELVARVRGAVGSRITGALEDFLAATGLDGAFVNTIDRYLERSSAFRSLRQAARDARRALEELEVTSVIDLTGSAAQGRWSATESWQEIAVYWSANCPPDRPPGCDRVVLFEGEPVVPAVARWEASRRAYDELVIAEHAIELRYGAILVYFLERVVLPKLTGGQATTLTEAFAYWFDCDALAASVVGADGVACALGACVEGPQLASFCAASIEFVFQSAELALSSLALDLGVRVGGTATLFEDSSDGAVDRLESGRWSGELIEGSGAGAVAKAPVSATWRATRVER